VRPARPGMSLLDEHVRPSIDDVAYVNWFPFKTSANSLPLNSPFRRHVWRTYVGRLLDLLTPVVIVLMEAWASRGVEAELEGAGGSPELIPVWHPSAGQPREVRSELEVAFGVPLWPCLNPSRLGRRAGGRRRASARRQCCNRGEAAVAAHLDHTVASDDQQDHRLRVLILDASRSAAGPDGTPAGCWISSIAGTSASRGLAAAYASMQ